MPHASNFDPYYRWLGIRPEHQPPDHYRLLGIESFESDRDVIRTAAERQAAHIQTFRIGPQSDLSQQLLNEIAKAKLCLLDQERKARYDGSLRAKITPPPTPAFPQHLPIAPPKIAKVTSAHKADKLRSATSPIRSPVAVTGRDFVSPVRRPRKAYKARSRKRRSSWGPALVICFALMIVAGIAIGFLVSTTPPEVKGSTSKPKSPLPPTDPKPMSPRIPNGGIVRQPRDSANRSSTAANRQVRASSHVHDEANDHVPLETSPLK